MRNANPSKMRLATLAIAALVALFVLTGCDNDNDSLRTERDKAISERNMAQTALMEAKKANEAAQKAVEDLEKSLEGITDRTSKRQTDLQTKLDKAEEDLKETQAILKALTMGLKAYKITVTNGLAKEKLAPIVVTAARNDDLLFNKDNYVTSAAENLILKGWPCMVLGEIEEGDGHAASNHPDPKKPQPVCRENKVTVDPLSDSEVFWIVTDASALRVIAMIAPTMYKDHYVTAVADVPKMGSSVTVPLFRFDIGYDEKEMDIELVAENAGTVTITEVDTGVDTAMMAADAMRDFEIVVTNSLSAEKLAPITVTRANDEHYLFNGRDVGGVTKAAKDQIIRGWPCMVLDAIAKGNATSNQLTKTQPMCEEKNKVTVAAGAASGAITFKTSASALRILAMIAPTPATPDHYVSAVVNVDALMMAGDSITAPLSRFDIGENEKTMMITRIDADKNNGMVKITRK